MLISVEKSCHMAVSRALDAFAILRSRLDIVHNHAAAVLFYGMPMGMCRMKCKGRCDGAE